MARPIKHKKVCKTPSYQSFGPLDQKKHDIIEICLEEYEVIRLIDIENLNQTECGKHMEISRATVQRLYESARKKLAQAFICGKTLEIKGGNYELCDGDHAKGCVSKCCKKTNQEV